MLDLRVAGVAGSLCLQGWGGGCFLVPFPVCSFPACGVGFQVLPQASCSVLDLPATAISSSISSPTSNRLLNSTDLSDQEFSVTSILVPH